jgi:hypothetical protein
VPIVLVLDALPDEPPDAALLGLTLGEARVAALVGNGQGPREAAERLGLTEGNRPHHAQVRVRQGWACRTRANWRRC